MRIRNFMLQVTPHAVSCLVARHDGQLTGDKRAGPVSSVAMKTPDVPLRYYWGRRRKRAASHAPRVAPPAAAIPTNHSFALAS